MAEIIKTTFQLRRGRLEVWERNNPVLAAGEPGFVLDKNLLKIGDGKTAWIDLPYIGEFNGEDVDGDPIFGDGSSVVITNGIVSIKGFSEAVPGAYLVKDEDGEATWIVPSISEEKIIEVIEKLEKEVYTKEEINEKFITKEELADISAYNKYEVFSKPEGTLVKVQENEIRIMCPKDYHWTSQTSGAQADKNLYYIGLKIYAPSKEIYGFKEDIAEIISDQTLYRFENNDFAGIDEYGRKYSIIWLPVARYNPETGEWTYYGATSTSQKYIGWHYSVEWYDVNDKLVGSDNIRINLSNEDCHGFNQPYYMGSINVNKLVQTDGDFLVLYGGSATDNIG